MAHFIPWEDISLNEDPEDDKVLLTKLHLGLFSLTTKAEKKYHRVRNKSFLNNNNVDFITGKENREV